MMKTIQIILIISILGAFASFGQENTWNKKSSFGGLKREKAVAFSIEEFGYVGCGIDTAEQTHNDLWAYDPEADTWTQKASIPGSPRRDAVAFAASGMGYVGTGFSHDDSELGVKLKDFWKYDPILNVWEGIADYPGGGDTGLYHGTGFSLLEKGYVACGKIGSNAYISELWQYDPETDVWHEKTSFSGGERYQLTSFTIHDKAYVGFGTDHDVFRKDIHLYDPISNAWEPLPDFPGSERAKPSSFSIGNKGFIVFGTDGGYKDELWEYDVNSATWTLRAPFPGGPRTNGIAFSIGDKGYAGLGKESDGKKQSFYQYIPKGPLSVFNIEVNKLNCYPNPFTTAMQIDLKELYGKKTIQLFTLSGTLLFETTTSNSFYKLSRTDLPPGTLILAVTQQNTTKTFIKKIVVE
ncbi:T9SS type A sorting domain-containing protein [Crocinitomix algicola]|uniref:T9SS type A sorting domain-containing protein n=1 Tax=Crocinitomix algicola TaxID=1740263 RepID=UPI0009F3B135|nr:T9SS type A sorting domain-containing protein [Crocinitomix algicola]